MTKTLGIVIAATVFAFSVHSAQAGLPEELRKCAAITDVAKRVACYDGLAAKDAASEAEKNKSRWSVTTTTSPITDRKDVFLRRRSDQTIKTSILGQASPVFLIQCINKKTSVAVNWDFIVGGGTLPVTYRIDSGKPETVNVTVADNFRSISSVSSERSVEFLKSLLGKKRLAVQITALSHGQVSAVFNVTGLETIITPLRKSCGW